MKNKIDELCNTVNKILNNEINIIVAARDLDRLRFYLNPDDELFHIFRAISSETEEYPISADERNLWEKSQLKLMDDKYSEYINSIRSDVNNVCIELIKKYCYKDSNL